MTVFASVAYQHPVSADVLRHVHDASAHWQRGDKALANIHLAFANLPGLEDHRHSDRLSLAEQLLDRGFSPRALMDELGFDPADLDLKRFDPGQARVSVGSGRPSGQWARAAGAVASAAQSFLAGASPRIVAALATFASRLTGATAVLGALFVPTPNSGGISEGELPGAPDIRFRKDGPAGTVRLTATDGSVITVFAQSRYGLIVNFRTDKAIGRDFGDQLYFDLDAVHTEAVLAERTEPDRRPKVDIEEPKLCPAPELDTPHGTKPHILDYEDDVHERVNPLAPIPRGFAIKFVSPTTGRDVWFDDCFRYAGDLVDDDMKPGDMVDAKGEEYERLLGIEGVGDSVMDKLIGRAERQTQVTRALGRGLKWYFAEGRAADLVRKRFDAKGLGDVVIRVMPPTKLKQGGHNVQGNGSSR